MGLSRTVSEIDGDFSRKLQNFPIPCILPPPQLTGFPLELGIDEGVRKTEMMGRPEDPKVFKIGLAD